MDIMNHAYIFHKSREIKKDIQLNIFELHNLNFPQHPPCFASVSINLSELCFYLFKKFQYSSTDFN